MNNNINKYLSLLLIQYQTEVLGVALDLQLFKILEKEPHTFQSLSKVLETNPHNTKILLDSLVLIDLLWKEGEFYKNEPIAQRFFVHGKKSYCGDVFLHRQNMLESGRTMIKDLVKDGIGKVKNSPQPKKWADVAKRFLRQEQENLMLPTALDIVKNLKDFQGMKKFLDLGCSSGIIGLEIAKENPLIQGVLFDYKEVTDIAGEHIKEYGLESRVKTLSGDIEKNDIGSGYDLIWCSNIFYFFQNKEEVIQKIYDSLNPNGILVSIHVEVDENSKENIDNYFYFLFLNMQERSVLRPMELTNLFKEIGFKSINSYTTHDTPMTPNQVHIVKK
ncbi:MAG: methyltransferase [Campylobacterales bacterium]|nr:methyltransferase [Campylobacterales bacterium]